MYNQIGPFLRERRADLAMSLIVIVWGVHYIVVKDAIAILPPLAFNAIRFMLGLPVLLIAGLRRPAALRIARGDIPRLFLLGLIGPLGYQILFILALARTTSTNTALLTATMPTWTALLTIVMGIVIIRRQMLLGVAISLAGVVLVILGQSSEGLSVSASDLAGSGLVLAGAVVVAYYNITIKPLIDRYGGAVIALWTYILTAAGLIIAAAPDLITLTPDEVPVRVWPHLFFSGILSCAMGFLTEYYALRTLGPARLASYYNVLPIIAALAGVLIMGDPLTVPLIVGAALTLWGVKVVRRNTFLRLPPEKSSQAVPESPREPVPAVEQV
jgi:drug/metabolite transporter (DMT)-like permease